MKQKVWTLRVCAVLLAVGLAACAAKPAPASSAPQGEAPESDTSQGSLPAQSEAESVSSEPEAPDALTPANEIALEYDRLWPVTQLLLVPKAVFAEGDGQLHHLQFYTVEKDGKWGLMTADGTEVLPCEGDAPVYLCDIFPEKHWHWDAPLSWEEFDALSARLKPQTGYALGDGHGGGSSRFVWIQGEESKGAQEYREMEGGGTVAPVSDASVFAREQGWLPVYYAELRENEMWGGLAPFLTQGANFANKDGKLLVTDEKIDEVGRFTDTPLAPVERGGKWAYIGTDGAMKTEFVYEGAWMTSMRATDGGYVMENDRYAYNFYDAFAPVKRNGKWGVLDASAKELVPCEYEGAAPADGGAWLKKDGVWRQYRLVQS